MQSVVVGKEVYYVSHSLDWSCVSMRRLHPKTGKPWQALRCIALFRRNDQTVFQEQALACWLKTAIAAKQALRSAKALKRRKKTRGK